MSVLPAPLTPADCDLQNFPRLMIDVTRLFGSSFNASASRNPLAWMIGHKLWYRSWHQIPAASLPDDDGELCHLAELGFDLKSFSKAKALAMRGWIKCSDGRLYHPVVAELAHDAWRKKQEQAYRTECARLKKHNQRHPDRAPIVPPEMDAWIMGGCLPVSTETAPLCPEGHGGVSPGTTVDVSRETASNREGEGEGEGQGDSKEEASLPVAKATGGRRKSKRSKAPASYPPAFQAAWAAYPHHKGRSSKPKSLELWSELDPDLRERLPAACAAFAKGGDHNERDNGARAMEGWLGNGLHLNWLPEAVAPPITAPDQQEVWRRTVQAFAGPQAFWPADAGPRPGKEGCRAPAEILAEFGLVDGVIPLARTA